MSRVIALLSLALLATAAQGDERIDTLAQQLAEARQGNLVALESPWLAWWELPHEVRRRHQPPEFQMKVLQGADPYVMIGGRIRRPGDHFDGYEVLAIIPDGVVLEVDGYAVLVD